MNARLLLTGCLAIISVALVSGQTPRPPRVTSIQAASPQAPAPRVPAAPAAVSPVPDVSKQRALIAVPGVSKFLEKSSQV